MKRQVLFVFLLIVFIDQNHAGARRIKYWDSFDIWNCTSKRIYIHYTAGERVVPSSAISDLDMGTYLIPLSGISSDSNFRILASTEKSFLWLSFYNKAKYNKITPWEKFKLMVAALTVTDKEGNVLLTLDDITEEDFEIHREGSTTTATLIIRERDAL